MELHQVKDKTKRVEIMKVIIVDDHPLVQEGIRSILSRSDLKVDVIGQAENAAELLTLLSKKEPDIVLLDVSLPDRNGIDVLHDLKKMYPKLPILILSMHPERRFAVRALKAGAAGYLNKAAITKELIQAISTIVKQKKRYINTEVAEELADQITGGGDQLPHEALSDREYEVLTLIVNGKKVSEIAEILSLSVQTIHTYRSRIKDKMDMNSNAELIRYAVEHHLVE